SGVGGMLNFNRDSAPPTRQEFRFAAFLPPSPPLRGREGEDQIASQLNTSADRSSGYIDCFMAGMPCSASDCTVQPSARCTERSGRDWLIRNTSFMRTATIWPVTSFDASLNR